MGVLEGGLGVCYVVLVVVVLYTCSFDVRF